MIAKAARNPRLPLRIYGKYKRDKQTEKKAKRKKSLLMQIRLDKHISCPFGRLLVRSLGVVEVGLNITINSVGEVGKIFGIEIY